MYNLYYSGLIIYLMKCFPKHGTSSWHSHCCVTREKAVDELGCVYCAKPGDGRACTHKSGLLFTGAEHSPTSRVLCRWGMAPSVSAEYRPVLDFCGGAAVLHMHPMLQGMFVFWFWDLWEGWCGSVQGERMKVF